MKYVVADEGVGKKKVGEFVLLLWGIWTSRNQLIFENKITSSEELNDVQGCRHMII